MRNTIETWVERKAGRLRSLFLGRGFAFFSATDEEYEAYRHRAKAEGKELNDYLLLLWNKGEFKENPMSR